jgi:hypothetical protein
MKVTLILWKWQRYVMMEKASWYNEYASRLEKQEESTWVWLYLQLLKKSWQSWRKPEFSEFENYKHNEYASRLENQEDSIWFWSYLQFNTKIWKSYRKWEVQWVPKLEAAMTISKMQWSLFGYLAIWLWKHFPTFQRLSLPPSSQNDVLYISMKF